MVGAFNNSPLLNACLFSDAKSFGACQKRGYPLHFLFYVSMIVLSWKDGAIERLGKIGKRSITYLAWKLERQRDGTSKKRKAAEKAVPKARMRPI
ncbi:hypothetical protein TIFTF001_053643 [Ficus carica]|uniref:Uncharacterized protein n=1 Tax=Ficus carica TaxID=3494 RepID=A0AA88EE33_FICCA|nr:hypothetical protein TIFTF001_053643 [Ficus carica]